MDKLYLMKFGLNVIVMLRCKREVFRCKLLYLQQFDTF